MTFFKSKIRNEDPERLSRFLVTLNSASWKGDRCEAMSMVFAAVNELIQHEVRFYYRARNKHRWVSMVTRLLAVVLGGAGTVAPLLAAADPPSFGRFGAYGYVLLAGAGTALAANRLFGMTGGHIRFVSAQLELEQLVTVFRLDWAAWLARTNLVHPEDVAEGFRLLRAFAISAYKIVREETKVWGATLTESLGEYEAHLNGLRSRTEPATRVSATVAGEHQGDADSRRQPPRST